MFVVINRKTLCKKIIKNLNGNINKLINENKLKETLTKKSPEDLFIDLLNLEIRNCIYPKFKNLNINDAYLYFKHKDKDINGVSSIALKFVYIDNRESRDYERIVSFFLKKNWITKQSFYYSIFEEPSLKLDLNKGFITKSNVLKLYENGKCELEGVSY